MGKIESPEIKEYIKNFVPNTLNNCDLFTSTFGKNFAKKNLDKNLNIVYTNVLDEKCDAYQNSNDFSINYCVKDENVSPLSVHDIENNELLQSITLHESLHVMLTTKHKNINRTGMLERYSNGTEIGRGLNEGLTNWICDKANVPNNSYPTLTNFMYQIEVAIGEKNVMNCAKGNIKRNIAKQLHMSPQECQAFLATADNVLSLKTDIKELNNIIQLLDNPLTSKDDLESYQLYNLILDSNNYNKLENDDSIDNTYKCEKNIFDNEKKNFENELLEAKTLFENQLYNKYFREEFEELIQADDMHIDKLEKFSKLYKFLRPEKVLETSDIGYFKIEYEKLKERYYNNIISQIEKESKNGTLSGNKLDQLSNMFEQLKEGDNVANFTSHKLQFYDAIKKAILPNTTNDIYYLFYFLGEKNNFKDINQYSISKISIGNDEITTCFKNGKLDVLFDKYGIKPTNEPNINLDITTESDEAYQIIMNKFLNLKKDIQAKNPDTTFKILNRLIVVENNNKESYYLIGDKDISPANIKYIEQINANLAPNTEELPVVYNKSFFSKITEKFKNSNLLNHRKNSEENIEYTCAVNYEHASKEQAFRKSISNITRYSNLTEQSTKIKQEDKELDR